jgi:hypothetical protein
LASATGYQTFGMMFEEPPPNAKIDVVPAEPRTA